MNARPLPPGRVRAASPQPGNQDERSCRSPYGCLAPGDGCPFHCPITDAEAAEMNAAAAAGETGAGEEEAEACPSTGIPLPFCSCGLHGPSAGQDTGQIRAYRCCPHCKDDAIHDVPENGHDLPCDVCNRDHEIDDLRRELDQARGQVRRVREYAAGLDISFRGSSIPTEIRRALDGAT